MKNPIAYGGAVIVVGIIALILGAYLRFASNHHTIGLAGLIVGAILVIVGIVAMFVVKPRRV